MRRTRVVHIIQNLNYGGMERLLHDIVLRLDSARFESHVLALQFLGRFAEGLEESAGLHVAGPQEAWSMLRPRSLSRQIQGIAPDVVHTHSGVWYKASLAARLAGVPRLIHTEHGRPSPDPWQARLVDGVASRRTDVVVAVSAPLAEYLRRHLLLGRPTVVTVPNGVDTETFRPREGGALRRELGLGPVQPIIGSVGRLERVKCYDLMIEAFLQLYAAWPTREGEWDTSLERSGRQQPPALVIVGEGSERPRLQAMLRGRPEGRHVHLLGWRDDIQEIHADFTLFTLSSRSEGTSVSLLEAMSAGLCPVVTDVGGNAAILGSRLRHRLVPPGDCGALAAAWKDALAGQEARRRDGLAARRRVQASFEIESTVDAYGELYAESELPSDRG